MKPLNTMTIAALLASAAFAAAPASASIVTIKLTTGGGNPIDTFTLDSTAGQPDAAGTPPYVYFNLLSDADGYNAVYFGDSSAPLGQLGIGYGSGNLVAQHIVEYFSPAFYKGVGVDVPFHNGVYGTSSGDILTVSGAAPEPATWALMMVGVGLMGVGMRARRRIGQSEAFAK